jgi:hypothetical protein
MSRRKSGDIVRGKNEESELTEEEEAQALSSPLFTSRADKQDEAMRTT